MDMVSIANTSLCIIRKNCAERLEWKDNKWWLDHLSFRSRRSANDFIKSQLQSVNPGTRLKIEKVSVRKGC